LRTPHSGAHKSPAAISPMLLRPPLCHCRDHPALFPPATSCRAACHQVHCLFFFFYYHSPYSLPSLFSARSLFFASWLHN
jgi:hypothetical protein